MLETTNAQEWLDKEYPIKKRNEIHFLAIDGKNLEGELEIRDFSNLEMIECFKNKLTNLKIINCPKVNHLNISCNSLKSLEFLNDLDAEKLIFLSIHTNNFLKSDLTPFSKFINLEELYLDNYDKDLFEESKYNRFYGSLEPLKNLKNLRLLNISGTDIDSGLEYLADSVSKIGCDGNNLKDEIGCLKIKKELENAAKDLNEEVSSSDEWETKWTKGWCRLAPWKEKRELLEEKLNVKFWLEKEYPLWIRKDIKDLWIHSRDLWKDLSLTDFPNLERLYCYNNKIRKLELINLDKLTEIHAWNNRLTELNIDNCPNIKILNVNNNRLTNLEFLEKVSHNSKLEVLDIANNNFHKKSEKEENKKEPLGLDIFKEFANLKELYIGSWGNKTNYFESSLKPLEKLDKLEYLGIDNTDIDTGLNDLPENLKEIHCGTERKSAKCRIIWEKLKKYSIPGRRYSYDFQAWLRNSEINNKEKILKRFFNHQTKLIKELKNLEEIDKKIKNQKKNENSSKWLGYAGGGLSTVGSGISSILSSTGHAEAGTTLSFISPSISGIGGVFSIIGAKWSSKLAEEEKNLEEELNNNLMKLGINFWNKFLRDREELEEKRSQIGEFILKELFKGEESEERKTKNDKEKKVKESFDDFLKISEGLPKSLSSEEKERMKKELQEEFILNLWENHWVKNDYELRKRLENFLNRIAEKMLEKPEEIIKTKLNNLLKELEGIKDSNKTEQLREEMNKYLQKLEIKDEKKEIEEASWNLINKTKKYLNSWLSLESAHRENKELKRKIQELEELKETQIRTASEQQEIEKVKNLEIAEVKKGENLETQTVRKRTSHHSIDMDINAQIQVPDK
jgi:hypothetical protein